MKPKQFFFIILGVIGGLILVGGAAYYFALMRLNTLSTNYSAQLANQEAVENELSLLARLQLQYARDIKPILPLMDEALPRTKNQTEILVQLQRISSANGLALTGVTFPSPSGLPSNVSQTITSGAVLALPISFQLSGSYNQLQSFLTQVENLSRFTNVTTLSVSRPDKSKPIVYTMTLNAYVKP